MWERLGAGGHETPAAPMHCKQGSAVHQPHLLPIDALLCHVCLGIAREADESAAPAQAQCTTLACDESKRMTWQAIVQALPEQGRGASHGQQLACLPHPGAGGS